ncbi:MAG: hypothetical protein WB791_02390 [Waddliaceae bacterium]
MKRWNRFVTYLVLITMVCCLTHDGESQEYCVDTGGCAYEDCYCSCCMAPAIALAVAALAAIIAVGLHNRSNGGHQHQHCE